MGGTEDEESARRAPARRQAAAWPQPVPSSGCTAAAASIKGTGAHPPHPRRRRAWLGLASSCESGLECGARRSSESSRPGPGQTSTAAPPVFDKRRAADQGRYKRKPRRDGPEGADGDSVDARDEAASDGDKAPARQGEHRRHRARFAAQLAALQAPRAAHEMHAQAPALACTILHASECYPNQSNMHENLPLAAGPGSTGTSCFGYFLSSFPKKAIGRSNRCPPRRIHAKMNLRRSTAKATEMTKLGIATK